MAEMSPLELQHLDINSFKSSERSWNQDEKNRFCKQPRLFGGSRDHPQSADELLWIEGRCGELHELKPAFSIHSQIGFPNKGVYGSFIFQENMEGFQATYQQCGMH
ncbi:hypothetical protein BDV29DRAFT_180636 [Aspergillus leporis]|jgi:hypothetical protein|uniref:Uncharacterized protein n=1 Tax=Aspergillus leporis TaxID=41062 RepID=A0A5N5WU61_9EURO|nr:hypothetical protein BDV29DRAFT_180636 [Aspergillus leporis]